MPGDILRDPLSLFDVAGKVTVITGASGALGRAAAIALGALGARLLLVSGSADGLASVASEVKVAAEVKGAGGEVTTLACRPDSEQDAAGIRSLHLGLTSMEERARELDGRLRIDSSPGHGTTVRIELTRHG